MMSFDGATGFTATGTADDRFAVGDGRMRNNAANPFSGGATYYVTWSGNQTFTAKFRETANAVCTFNANAIILQVIN
jgi:hypothetical protein